MLSTCVLLIQIAPGPLKLAPKSFPDPKVERSLHVKAAGSDSVLAAGDEGPRGTGTDYLGNGRYIVDFRS